MFFLLHSYLQSVEGGSKGKAAAGQETVDLGKFLKLVDPSTCDLKNVTYMKHIVTYLNKLRECGVGPSGQVTKLTTLGNAVRMLVSRVSDTATEEEKDLVVRSKVVETKLKGITKTLRKECSTIRLQKRTFSIVIL